MQLGAGLSVEAAAVAEHRVRHRPQEPLEALSDWFSLILIDFFEGDMILKGIFQWFFIDFQLFFIDFH